MENNTSGNSYLKMGFYSSVSLSILTIITFVLAMMAIPPSGPYCTGNCMDYPFSDLLLYFPRDYYWMYVVILQLFAFIVFVVSNHFIANTAKKLFTFLSIVFTLISSTVLLIAYYTQFSVVPVSVMSGETEGIALITQYNGHGLFIAMEELGYITMSVGLFFLGFAFSKAARITRVIRIILNSQLHLTIMAFIFYIIKFGLNKSYLFEVITITINWIVIIVVSILTGLSYRKTLRLAQEHDNYKL